MMRGQEDARNDRPPGLAAEDRSIREFDKTTSAVKASFASYRTLDPVRAAALTAAVRLMSVLPVPRTEDVLGIAKRFEAYLTGEEADGS